MKKKLFFYALCLAFLGAFAATNVVEAQVKQVTGVVVSKSDGSPVAGATILVKGTRVGTAADENGKFAINASGNSTLVVSFIGMKTAEVTVNGRTVVNVELEDEGQALDEVMVVAFGTEKKKAFTGSATVIGKEELAKRVTTNVVNALVGATPGLQMHGSSGAPGAGSGSINIRGIASMYAGTDPLVIVDGAPYSASLSNIPQSDVESITVLKDAASAALYGARGAAGVILVTTKSSKSQKAEVHVDAKWGANTRAIQNYDVVKDPGAFYEAYYAEAYNYNFYGRGLDANTANIQANKTMLKDLVYNVFSVPQGEQLIGLNGKLNPNAKLGNTFKGSDGLNYYLIPDDWNDLVYKTALRQEYNISVNGGSNRGNYYMSLGYLDEDGVIDYYNYNRVSARLKADYKVFDWLKVGANIGYNHSKNKSAGGNAASTTAMDFSSRMAPIYPAYVRLIDDKGNVSIKQNDLGMPVYDYGEQIPGMVNRPVFHKWNAMAANKYDEYYTDGDQLNGTFNAEADITPWLKASVTSTITWGRTYYSYYQNSFYDPKASVNGDLVKYFSDAFRQNHVQTLTFHKLFGKHSVNVMAGHEYYKTNSKYLEADANGGFSPTIHEINAFANRYNSFSYNSGYNVEGYFGSAQYNYAEKYFLSASYRRDASSTFAKDHRWGDFWSAGAAWLLTEEKFMQGTRSWLDMLKLKFSIGQQGNDNVGSYAYIDTYSLSKDVANYTMTPSFRQKGNPDITWETTTNMNVGLEFGLFKGRLNGTVDFYNKKTADLLFWLSIPESSGTRGYYGNLGDIRNTGVEVTLTGNIVRSKLVDWSVSANIAHNKVKILKLPESKIDPATGGFSESNGPRTYQNWLKEGGSMYNAFMPIYAGVNEQGEATYWVSKNTIVNGALKTDIPGDSKDYLTTNLNEASRYEHGSVLPKFFGGFSTTLRVWDFDMSATFDYQIGGKVYDNHYESLMSPITSASDAGYAIHKDYAKAWSPNNTGSNIPRWQYSDQFATGKSDRFLTKASYLNFQSFTVGYNVPKKWLKGVQAIRLYVVGENLYFWSARKGLDPRYSFDGNTSSSVYSPVRTISGGIQITL